MSAARREHPGAAWLILCLVAEPCQLCAVVPPSEDGPAPAPALLDRAHRMAGKRLLERRAHVELALSHAARDLSSRLPRPDRDHPLLHSKDRPCPRVRGPERTMAARPRWLARPLLPLPPHRHPRRGQADGNPWALRRPRRRPPRRRGGGRRAHDLLATPIRSRGALVSTTTARPGVSWRHSNLPQPPPYTLRNVIRVIGPGAILLGLSLGSGDWVLGPVVTARWGTTFLWICAVSVLLQALLNTEMARYTLATGESIFAGFMRGRSGPRFWASVYTLLHLAQVGWPGWALAAAAALVAAFLGRPLRPEDGPVIVALGYLIFLGAVFVTFLGPQVRRTVELCEWLVMGLALLFLAALAMSIVRWTTWVSVLVGFLSPVLGEPAPPSDMDWWLLVAFAAYSGGGGTINASLTHWLRDKGFGMAGTVDGRAVVVGGETVRFARDGMTFAPTELNLAKWRQWWRYRRHASGHRGRLCAERDGRPLDGQRPVAARGRRGRSGGRLLVVPGRLHAGGLPRHDPRRPVAAHRDQRQRGRVQLRRPVAPHAVGQPHSPAPRAPTHPVAGARRARLRALLRGAPRAGDPELVHPGGISRLLRVGPAESTPINSDRTISPDRRGALRRARRRGCRARLPRSAPPRHRRRGRRR